MVSCFRSKFFAKRNMKLLSKGVCIEKCGFQVRPYGSEDFSEGHAIKKGDRHLQYCFAK